MILWSEPLVYLAPPVLIDGDASGATIPIIFTGRGNIAYDQIRTAARQGHGTKFQMFGGGTTSPGDIAVYDIGGNVIDGGFPFNVLAIRNVAVSSSMTNADYTIVATTPAITITLPVSPARGQLANIKNSNPTVGQTISVTAGGAVLIDGGTSVTVGATASLHVQWDGTQWWIL